MTVNREMPRYICHKQVWALKIESVQEGVKDKNSVLLTFADEGYAPIHVDFDWYYRHKPEAGGYYVVYKDGYKSFSPAAAFEDGYTLQGAALAPQNDDETEGLRAHIALLKASLAQCERELDELRVAAQAPQEPEEPLPPPGIHAAVHYAGWLRREAHRHQEPKAGVLRQAARMLDVLKAECGRLHQELIDAQAPAVPPEKPLPDLMMASYHEAVGWNACRAAMLANSPAVAPAVPEESTTAARDEFPMLYDSLDALDERAAEQPERIGTQRHLSSLRTSIQAVVQKLSLARARISDLESAAQAPAHLLERLRRHAADTTNTAFSRAAMTEALQYLERAQAPAANGDALDAARYRWLRERWGRLAESYVGPVVQAIQVLDDRDIQDGIAWDVDPESLDRAIDAARSTPAKGGE